MRAGENREPDRVYVLLDGGRDDLLRCLVQPGVDDLHAGVAQRAGDHLRPPVVAVEPGLRDDHPDLAHDGKPSRDLAQPGRQVRRAGWPAARLLAGPDVFPARSWCLSGWSGVSVDYPARSGVSVDAGDAVLGVDRPALGPGGRYGDRRAG